MNNPSENRNVTLKDLEDIALIGGITDPDLWEREPILNGRGVNHPALKVLESNPLEVYNVVREHSQQTFPSGLSKEKLNEIKRQDARGRFDNLAQSFEETDGLRLGVLDLFSIWDHLVGYFKDNSALVDVAMESLVISYCTEPLRGRSDHWKRLASSYLRDRSLPKSVANDLEGLEEARRRVIEMKEVENMFSILYNESVYGTRDAKEVKRKNDQDPNFAELVRKSSDTARTLYGLHISLNRGLGQFGSAINEAYNGLVNERLQAARKGRPNP